MHFAGAPSGYLLSPTALRIVATISFVAVTAIISIGTPRKRHSSIVDILTFLSAVVVMGILTFAHFSARGTRTPLAGLGMLLSGEDNAKWLEFTSHLTTNTTVSMHGGNGGGQSILLALTVAIAGVLSHLLLGETNQVGVEITGVILAHAMLASLSFLAVGSLVTKTWSREGSRAIRLFAIALPLIFSSAVLASGVILSYDKGQLTAEFVMVALAFGLGSLLRPDLRVQDFVLCIIVLSGIGFVWLPLIAFGPIVAIIGLFLGLRIYPAKDKPVGILLAIVLSLNLAMTLVNTYPDFSYILTQSSDGTPLKSLVTADGGTAGSEWYLTLVACASLGTVAFFFRPQLNTMRAKTHATLPMLVLAALVALAWFYDAWSTSEPGHYGTLKMTWVACVVIASVCGRVSLDSATDYSRKPNSTKVYASLALILLFTFTGMFPRALGQFSPDHWSRIVASPGEPGWAKFLEPDENFSNTIAKLPVGCIVSSSSGFTANFESYRCTRFLVSMRGIEKQATPLIDMQLYGLSAPLRQNSKAVQDLNFMTESVRGLNLLELNEAGRVIGLVSVQQFERSLPKA
jgi:hypothetical protein